VNGRNRLPKACCITHFVTQLEMNHKLQRKSSVPVGLDFVQFSNNGFHTSLVLDLPHCSSEAWAVPFQLFSASFQADDFFIVCCSSEITDFLISRNRGQAARAASANQ
jgi:hypothetical protein